MKRYVEFQSWERLQVPDTAVNVTRFTWQSENDVVTLDKRTAAVLALGEMLIAASKSSDEPEWGYDYYLKDYPGFSRALTVALVADADAAT